MTIAATTTTAYAMVMTRYWRDSHISAGSLSRSSTPQKIRKRTHRDEPRRLSHRPLRSFVGDLALPPESPIPSHLRFIKYEEP